MVVDFGKRPASLCEAVRRVKDGEQEFDAAIREFLDTFYSAPTLRNEAIAQRPDKLERFIL